MSRTLMILLAMVLSGCAPHQPSTVQWDAAASQEVRAQVERTMGAFASMDVEGFKAGLAEDVVGFEMDLEGKPGATRVA